MENKIPYKKFLPGIAWFFIVAVLTMMPGNDLPNVDLFDSIWEFDKLVHAGLFGGITFLFCLPFIGHDISRKSKIFYFLKISIAAIVWGISVEFIQKYFIPGRSFDLLDWAADTLGVVAGYWLALMALTRYEKKHGRE